MSDSLKLVESCNLKLSEEEWAFIEKYAITHYFSSVLEAIRVSIGRALTSKDSDINTPTLSQESRTKKKLLFTTTQWNAINTYHSDNSFPSRNDTIKHLIFTGITLDKKYWG
jgi:hypothetical protein